eukprot:TRINITY_DN3158_c0_g1_i1.p1 TRINITY_DN3158_c0_g1~~TRINITY_DN3158_c0_g1_i1.p1  ORF type:complete len:711 (-),score=175.07 TRINITY_DN3158_c0_g1_i1:17-2149(-)
MMTTTKVDPFRATTLWSTATTTTDSNNTNKRKTPPTPSNATPYKVAKRSAVLSPHHSSSKYTSAPPKEKERQQAYPTKPPERTSSKQRKNPKKSKNNKSAKEKRLPHSDQWLSGEKRSQQSYISKEVILRDSPWPPALPVNWQQSCNFVPDAIDEDDIPEYKSGTLEFRRSPYVWHPFAQIRELPPTHEIRKVATNLKGTDTKAYGLFATRLIRKGQWLGSYAGLFISSDTPGDFSYRLSWNGGNAIDALNYGNESRYINDAINLTGCSVNVEFLEKGLRRVGKALRDIQPGEELFIEYGEKYWQLLDNIADEYGSEDSDWEGRPPRAKTKNIPHKELRASTRTTKASVVKRLANFDLLQPRQKLYCTKCKGTARILRSLWLEVDGEAAESTDVIWIAKHRHNSKKDTDPLKWIFRGKGRGAVSLADLCAQVDHKEQEKLPKTTNRPHTGGRVSSHSNESSDYSSDRDDSSGHDSESDSHPDSHPEGLPSSSENDSENVSENESTEKIGSNGVGSKTLNGNAANGVNGVKQQHDTIKDSTQKTENEKKSEQQQPKQQEEKGKSKPDSSTSPNVYPNFTPNMNTTPHAAATPTIPTMASTTAATPTAAVTAASTASPTTGKLATEEAVITINDEDDEDDEDDDENEDEDEKQLEQEEHDGDKHKHKHHHHHHHKQDEEEEEEEDEEDEEAAEAEEKSLRRERKTRRQDPMP